MFFFDPSDQFINSNYSQRFDPIFGSFSSAETLHRFMGRNMQQYQCHDIATSIQRLLYTNKRYTNKEY